MPKGPDGHPSKEMSEEEEDLRDALCPIYDQLTLAPSWWILEVKFKPMRATAEGWAMLPCFADVLFSVCWWLLVAG